MSWVPRILDPLLRRSAAHTHHVPDPQSRLRNDSSCFVTWREEERLQSIATHGFRDNVPVRLTLYSGLRFRTPHLQRRRLDQSALEMGALVGHERN